MAKNILIVFAHEEKKSLNATLKNWMSSILQEFGHEVKVSDLYAQNFDPVIKRKDFLDLPDDAEHLNYSMYAGKCYKKKTLAPYIMEETEKVSWADMVIFQFPIYWYSVPAILKGWIDKVLISGFAFDFSCGGVLENGLLKDKKALLSVTTGAGESMYSPKGLASDININLWPIQYTFGICGMEILKPFVVYGANYLKEENLEIVKEQLRKRLSGIFEDEPMKILPLNSYSFPQGELNDEFEAEDKAPTVGQHMGKPIINV